MLQRVLNTMESLPRRESPTIYPFEDRGTFQMDSDEVACGETET